MTLTERLREQIRAAAKTCPTCGQSTEAGGVRALAEKIGVSHTTLWRFLRGADTSSDTLDRIDAWLRSIGVRTVPPALPPVNPDLIGRMDGKTLREYDPKEYARLAAIRDAAKERASTFDCTAALVR